MPSSFITDYWGKAWADQSCGPRWHPLAYHALDVAAVADELLERMPRRLERMADIAAAPPDQLRRALVFLIALHDVGKMSQRFQAKADCGPQRDPPLPAPPPGVRQIFSAGRHYASRARRQPVS
ncbi:MAG: CRISPR-associated endonuclease Cas3'' [Hyphomicrobiaceae bacterium]